MSNGTNGSARRQRRSSSSKLISSCSAIRPSFGLIGISFGQRVVEAGVEGGIGVGFGELEGFVDFFGDAFFELGLLVVGEEAFIAEAFLVEGDRVALLCFFG